MNSVSTLDLNFKGIQLRSVPDMDGIWLTSSQLGCALQYADDKAINRIYTRRADEFTSNMTGVVKVTTPYGEQMTRVFSLRGAHLIAMFSRTPVAKEFRKWVLDILDKEVEQGGVSPMSYQLLCRVEHGKQIEIKMFSSDSTVDDVDIWMSHMQHRGARFLFSEEQKNNFVREQLSKFLN